MEKYSVWVRITRKDGVMNDIYTVTAENTTKAKDIAFRHALAKNEGVTEIMILNVIKFAEGRKEA